MTTLSKVQSEALDWFFELAEHPDLVSVRAEFQAWVRASKAHRDEFAVKHCPIPSIPKGWRDRLSQHVESERCGRTELKAHVRLVTPDLRPHEARESTRPTMLLTRIARFRSRFDYDIYVDTRPA